MILETRLKLVGDYKPRAYPERSSGDIQFISSFFFNSELKGLIQRLLASQWQAGIRSSSSGIMNSESHGFSTKPRCGNRTCTSSCFRITCIAWASPEVFSSARNLASILTEFRFSYSFMVNLSATPSLVLRCWQKLVHQCTCQQAV